jgi:hypothetical protein
LAVACAQAEKVDVRSRVVLEILTTERTFVHHLRSLIDVYMDPLRSHKILTPVEMNTLFSNWEALVRRYIDIDR